MNINTPMSSEANFSTKDITLAATLNTLLFKISGIKYQYEGTRPKPVGYFEFPNSENLQKAITGFLRGELAVEPRSFMMHLRALKAEVSNIYKNPDSPL